MKGARHFCATDERLAACSSVSRRVWVIADNRKAPAQADSLSTVAFERGEDRGRVTRGMKPQHNQEEVWQTNTSAKINRAFEIMSKRRKGFPSETRVKKGTRVVHGHKELREKLGRNDPCPRGSGHRF